MANNTEHLAGAEAARYLANLRARHPGVFERAAADLRRRGLEDTGRVDVVRSMRNARSLLKYQNGSPYRLVDTASGSEGEIVYWTWDDGDYSTWEGSVYLNEYSTGTWISANCQTFVDEGREWTMVWDFMVDAGGPGVENTDPLNPVALRYGSSSASPLATAAVFRFGQQSEGGSPYQLVVDWDRVTRSWQNWAWCAAAGCAGAAVRCALVFPTPRERGECAAATCVGVGVGCLIMIAVAK